MSTVKARRDKMLATAVKAEGGKHSMTMADGRQFWDNIVDGNAKSFIANNDEAVTPEVMWILISDTMKRVKELKKVKGKAKTATAGTRAPRKITKTKSARGINHANKGSTHAHAR